MGGKGTISGTLLLLTLAFGLPGPAAQAGVLNPETGAKDAMKRLVTETKDVPRSAASKPTRTQLLGLAKKAKKASRRDPCGSLKLVTRYRKEASDVSARSKRAKRPGPASPRGTVLTAAFAADAALKQLSKTGKCGGGAAPGAETFEVETGESDTQGVDLSVALPRARWTATSGGGDDFTTLHMDGAESFGEVGDPGVPAFTDLVALPVGADITVEVVDAESYTIDAVEPFPKQEEAVDGQLSLPPSTFADPPFKINKPAFNAKAPVPAKLATSAPAGTLRDLGVAGIQVAGAQFKPKENKLEVFTRVDLNVKFGGANTGVWRTLKRTSVFERAFSRLYKATLSNYPTVAKDTGETDSDGQENLTEADETVLACGEDMLIVTSPTLRPAADTLADARRAAGLVVNVKETGTGAGQIGSAETEIRTFIRSEITSATCTRPTYVILLGDTSHVPTFIEDCPGDCGTIPSDLTYSLDGIGNDPFADVLLSRIPANTVAIANTVVGKIIGYETTLPAPAGDDFYNHATVTSYFEGLGPVDERTFTRAAETVRAGLRSRGHVVERLNSAQATADIQQFSDGTPMPAEIKRPAIPWTDGRDQIVNSFNDGRFFLMHRDHGSRLSWANPGININDIPLLNNGTQLPVVFAINCSSGGFQVPGNPSFVERLLNTPAGGAVGAFADTEVSLSTPNTRLAIGFGDALFPETVPGTGPAEPLTHMGEVLNAGKIAMGQGAPAASQLTGGTFRQHLLWHYLGDPSMQIWSATPTAFDPAAITTALEQPLTGANAPLDSGAFQIRVTMTQPNTDGTIATLRRNGVAIGRAVVQNGVAVITPDVRTNSDGLTVALEDDGFLQREVAVVSKAPEHDISCPPTISATNVTSNGQVHFGQAPAPFDVVRLRYTTPTRTFVRSVTTNSQGNWQHVEPIAGDSGAWKVEAFYNEDGTVGDAVCQFVVP